MNFIVKAWRKFKLVVAKQRQNINAENVFHIGDFVKIKARFSIGVTGEVVDSFYGYDMNRGYRWYYKVQYKHGSKNIVVSYE